MMTPAGPQHPTFTRFDFRIRLFALSALALNAAVMIGAIGIFVSTASAALVVAVGVLTLAFLIIGLRHAPETFAENRSSSLFALFGVLWLAQVVSWLVVRVTTMLF